MHTPAAHHELQVPALIPQAEELATYIKTLEPDELAHCMHLSPALAVKTHELYQTWTATPSQQSATIDSFVGDIYSGLRASTLSKADREYANTHLRILSGLYGVLRPFDGIRPYRLEMGYKLPARHYANLYSFWGNRIAEALPSSKVAVNLAAVEYSKAVLPFMSGMQIVTPKFLTRNPETGAPTFVVVHAKIARGAFARWLIASRITAVADLTKFADIGYEFEPAQSTPEEPVFICDTFQGKGLSMRLSN